MKILFSGGGTLGPVTPLLAIHETVKNTYPDCQFLWVGTKRGPERELVEQQGIRFLTLSSGKFRRYLSIWNVIDIVRIFIAWFQALKLLWKENPNLCISAGGFISAPIHWAAWLWGIPTWIHQQDISIGLANKLMARFARVITTSLKIHLDYFPKRKTQWLGNPVRAEIMKGSKPEALKLFKLDPKLPVIFATGGGTGSLRVNQLIIEAIPQLSGICQVIHLSGKDRPQELVERTVTLFSDYYQVYQFFTNEMAQAYAIADIVISRGGFGTISECAALSKPAIIIPKPGHQVQNVKFFESAEAVIHVNELTADGNYVAKIIKELLADKIRCLRLGKNLNKLLPRAEDAEILGIIRKNIINSSRL